MIVYFSSVSENTHRFVEKLDMDAVRIPLKASEAEEFVVSEPFVLIVPTYGAGGKGFVPPQVKKFLKSEENRAYCLGVVGSGNSNFGSEFALAGPLCAEKLEVPLLYVFELSGTLEDVDAVQKGISELVKAHGRKPRLPQRPAESVVGGPQSPIREGQGGGTAILPAGCE